MGRTIRTDREATQQGEYNRAAALEIEPQLVRRDRVPSVQRDLEEACNMRGVTKILPAQQLGDVLALSDPDDKLHKTRSKTGKVAKVSYAMDCDGDEADTEDEDMVDHDDIKSYDVSAKMSCALLHTDIP